MLLVFCIDQAQGIACSSEKTLFRHNRYFLGFIHKQPQELVFGKEKAPAIERSKSTQYYNMGSISIVRSRGFLKAKNPIFEVVCVYSGIS